MGHHRTSGARALTGLLVAAIATALLLLAFAPAASATVLVRSLETTFGPDGSSESAFVS